MLIQIQHPNKDGLRFNTGNEIVHNVSSEYFVFLPTNLVYFDGVHFLLNHLTL